MKRSALAGEGHPGALVEPTGGRVVLGGPDGDTLISVRTGDVEHMKDQGEADSRALCGGMHEHHRDVQERRVEFTRAVIGPPRLGQRHAHDARSQCHERQGI